MHKEERGGHVLHLAGVEHVLYLGHLSASVWHPASPDHPWHSWEHQWPHRGPHPDWAVRETMVRMSWLAGDTGTILSIYSLDINCLVLSNVQGGSQRSLDTTGAWLQNYPEVAAVTDDFSSGPHTRMEISLTPVTKHTTFFASIWSNTEAGSKALLRASLKYKCWNPSI